MTLRAALHLALCFLLLSALAGCAGLPFRDDAEQDAQTAPKRPPQFRLTVDAPSRLQALLLQHLDLARLQYAAEADALTRTEIDRLIGAAAAQAESLLNTEGYFNPVIKVQRVEDGQIAFARHPKRLGRPQRHQAFDQNLPAVPLHQIILFRPIPAPARRKPCRSYCQAAPSVKTNFHP